MKVLELGSGTEDLVVRMEIAAVAELVVVVVDVVAAAVGAAAARAHAALKTAWVLVASQRLPRTDVSADVRTVDCRQNRDVLITS